jgi:ABC-2 type transport system permease protein
MTAISLPARRSDVALLGRWTAGRVRMMLRSPRTLGFTLAFPLVLVTLFNSLNGDTMVAAMGPAGGDVRFAQYYTPSIGVFGLTIACSARRSRCRSTSARGSPAPCSSG